MDEREWVTAGYVSYLKKRKKKHSRALFQKYLERCFLDKGTDIRYPSSMPKVMNEMFWQTQCLKEAVGDLFHVFDVCRVADIVGRKHIIEKLRKLEGFYNAVERIFKVDSGERVKGTVRKIRHRKIQKSKLAGSVLRTRFQRHGALSTHSKTRTTNRRKRK